MHPYEFLIETYGTERIKTLGVWSHFTDADLGFRPEPRARTPLEQMVHQCVSEDTWMQRMLGIDAGLPPLPATENRLAFLEHYTAASGRRLELLAAQTADWFAGETRFFDVPRSRAWVLTRRIAHSAHHRGQLTAYLRMLGRDLYSTYGPTADTGGLFQQGAPVIYRYPTIDALLAAERDGEGTTAAAAGAGQRSADRAAWSAGAVSDRLTAYRARRLRWRLAPAALALAVVGIPSRSECQQPPALPPEEVARAVVRADSAGDWATLIRLAHPDALVRFRGLQTFQIRMLGNTG